MQPWDAGYPGRTPACMPMPFPVMRKKLGMEAPTNLLPAGGELFLESTFERITLPLLETCLPYELDLWFADFPIMLNSPRGVHPFLRPVETGDIRACSSPRVRINSCSRRKMRTTGVSSVRFLSSTWRKNVAWGPGFPSLFFLSLGAASTAEVRSKIAKVARCILCTGKDYARL